MSFERLWTPWRMRYIASGGEEGCIFCTLPQAGDDVASGILVRDELAYVLLNAYPYNPGHLMVTPFRHVAELEELTAQELAQIMTLTQRAVAAIKAAMSAQGFNLGLNLGQVAGAGIADHLHLHVVPRWGGDTNFMPIVGQTRVLPELLAETYDKLAPYFAPAGGDPIRERTISRPAEAAASRADALSWVRGAPFAHRGLFDANSGPPENSLPAFAAACEAGYGIELDVHLAQGGLVAVFHDETLDRLCGRPGRIADLRHADLTTLRLADSDTHVPSLGEVLALVGGRVPILVELKGRDARLLAPHVAALLDHYEGPRAATSFDPRVLKVLRRVAPDLPRGQLAGAQTWPGIARWQLATANRLMYDTVGRPAFYVYEVHHLNAPALVHRRRRGALAVAWTARTAEDLELARRFADNVIFEGVRPPVPSRDQEAVP